MLLLTLAGSDFASMLAATASYTDRTYADPELPLFVRALSREGGHACHTVLSDVLRSIDSELHPSARIEDAPYDSGVDWLRDGRRIAFRVAQLKWDTATTNRQGRWMVRWQGIRQSSEKAIEYWLALYTPDALHLFRHDDELGLTRSTGQVQLYGTVSMRGWRAAFELSILPKLCASQCEVLAGGPIPWDDARLITSATGTAFLRKAERAEAAVAASLAKLAGSNEMAAAAEFETAPHGDDYGDDDALRSEAYLGVPLSLRTGVARSTALTALTRAIDEQIHPLAIVEDRSSERGTIGRSLRESTWRRDGVLVHSKVAQLTWDPANMRWRVLWSNVELPDTDADGDSAASDLLLAFHTPRGVYLHRHDRKFGVSSGGRMTGKRRRFVIQAYGAKDERRWDMALDAILQKMESGGCSRLAFVDWSR